MTEHAEIDAALQVSAGGVAALLATVPDPGAMTPGGAWTVQQTAAHLLAGTRLYRRLLAGATSPLVRREDYASYNAGVFDAQPDHELGRLAAHIAGAARSFRGAMAAVDLDAARPWHYGRSLPAVFHAALVVNEYLMHGTDIARGAGLAWDGDDGAAAVAWRVLGPPLTTLRFLPGAAGDLEATFALGLRGEERAVFRVAGGEIRRDDAAAPECAVTGRPMALLRWFFQRDPWETAGLEASGPRPELATGLASLLRPI